MLHFAIQFGQGWDPTAWNLSCESACVRVAPCQNEWVIRCKKLRYRQFAIISSHEDLVHAIHAATPFLGPSGARGSNTAQRVRARAPSRRPTASAARRSVRAAPHRTHTQPLTCASAPCAVAYSPSPIGTQPSATFNLDFFTEEYSRIYERDLTRMAAAGVNALRIYTYDGSKAHARFLDACRARQITIPVRQDCR